LLAPSTVLKRTRTEQETPCFLMKQRHELKEKYSVFIVPWIHWALY
jgi:hypothetical protein